MGILEKVRSRMEADGLGALDAKVSARNPFGIPAHKIPATATKTQTQQNTLLLMTRNGDRFLRPDQVQRNPQALATWKVAISYAASEHAGKPDKDGRKRVLSLSRVLPPNSACTETYLIAGTFSDEETATAFLSYLRTRFCRFLLSLRVSTQHVTRSCYAFVPAMPTGRVWTDEDLYAHFGLDEIEVAHVEGLIKEMPG